MKKELRGYYSPLNGNLRNEYDPQVRLSYQCSAPENNRMECRFVKLFIMRDKHATHGFLDFLLKTFTIQKHIAEKEKYKAKIETFKLNFELTPSERIWKASDRNSMYDKPDYCGFIYSAHFERVYCDELQCHWAYVNGRTKVADEKGTGCDCLPRISEGRYFIEKDYSKKKNRESFGKLDEGLKVNAKYIWIDPSLFLPE